MSLVVYRSRYGYIGLGNCTDMYKISDSYQVCPSNETKQYTFLEHLRYNKDAANPGSRDLPHPGLWWVVYYQFQRDSDEVCHRLEIIEAVNYRIDSGDSDDLCHKLEAIREAN